MGGIYIRYDCIWCCYMYVGSTSGAHCTIGTNAQGTTARVSGTAHHLPQQTDEELSKFVCESESHIL